MEDETSSPFEPHEEGPLPPHARVAGWFQSTRTPTADLESDARALREELLAPTGVPSKLGRFTLTRMVGEGAVGTVYEAVDTSTGEEVAVKVLRRSRKGVDHIFKREISAIGDVRSPNVVKIYELGRDGDFYFIVMELIRGCDFVQYVRREDDTSARIKPPLDHDRLRASLKQLVAGLSALHRAGKVHRDVKPSNVLVTETGRVVLLDFGLVGAFGDPHKLESTLHGHVVGTPAYMAPEQFRAEPPIPASDWYAVGGVLFHALVGYPPFGNGPIDVLKSAKESGGVPVPSHFTSDVPADLDALCTRLLHPAPEERPDAEAILECLGPSTEDELRAAAPAVTRSTTFVGRQSELARLGQAFDASHDGCVAVTVSGPVGIGKTALVRAFLSSLKSNCAVLSVRCIERDRTSYKTLDRLVDELVRYLQRLPSITAMRLMPRHVRELAEFFPSLRRVDAVMMSPGPAVPMEDRFELRRRAIAALGELLGRIADTQSLVVWIDDLQWSDLESLLLLRGILHAKDAPHGLFIGTHNADPVSAERILARLFAVERSRPRVLFDRLEVNALPFADAATLAGSLVEDRETADWIARDTAGNPSWLVAVATQTPDPRREGIRRQSLAQLLRGQLDSLSVGARDFLRILAIARAALPLTVVADALGLLGSADQASSELRALRLIRTQGWATRSFVEIAHERFRELVLADIDRHSQLSLHGRLGRALARFQGINPEEVAYHLRAAGEAKEATQHLISGAHRASELLAYDRAARLYRAALRWTVDEREVATVRFRLADALRNAGYGSRDAEAYLEAAQEHPLSSVERFTLERMAAQELLFRGRLDRAEELTRDMLRSIGLSMPRSRIGAAVRLWARRLWLGLRSLRYRERVSYKPSDLVRFDTSFMLAQGLIIYDSIVGSHLFNRNVYLALRLGEPARVARALAFEAALITWNGSRSRQRSRRLLDEAKRAAEQVEDPYLEGLMALSEAVAATFTGELKRALREIQPVHCIFRERCRGIAFEQHVANLVTVIGHMLLGNFAELDAVVFPMLEDAMARDNVYQSVGLRSFACLARLMRDDVEGARVEMEMVQRDWAYDGFDMQHLGLILGLARLYLYTGQGVIGLRNLDDLWARLDRSMMLGATFIAAIMYALRGRLAVLAYAETRARRYRSLALRDARRVDRLDYPGSAGDAAAIRAGIASLDGQSKHAVELYRNAIAIYERDAMANPAALVRYRLGMLLGGTTGAALAAEADAALRGASIRNPPAFVQMYTGIPMRHALNAGSR